MTNTINVLFTGYSYICPKNNKYIRANGSSTLIRTQNARNIIVDTLTAWDGKRLCEALQQYQLQPADIHHIVCTHGHSDHIGCNYLFTNALSHIVGMSVSKEDQYEDIKFTYEFQLELDKDVVVIATPGHTGSCVSVIVRNTNIAPVIGICGDLFERKEDIFNESIWLEAGSEKEEEQRKNRLKIANKCNFIIPGHGPGFTVTDIMREKLKEDTVQLKKSHCNF